MDFELFENRIDAGKRLAVELLHYASDPDLLILALPRGGVPVASEVAMLLNAPWDVFPVRKLGLPTHPEFAMGAIASGGFTYLDEAVIRESGVSDADLRRVIHAEQMELSRRERIYRAGKSPLNLKGKTVVLIDDGLATGASLQAAVQAVKAQCPKRLVVAVPVAAENSAEQIEKQVDAFVCVEKPSHFRSVGQWYHSFPQTSDAEVETLLSSTRLSVK